MYVTRNQNDTTLFGRALGNCLRAGDCVLLYGGLGAGKSVLARGMARALGVTDAMASPTFTLMQPYAGTACPVYHFDLYRLSDPDAFFQAGLSDFLGGDGVALIEWPQQADLMPPVRIEIDMERSDHEGDARQLDVQAFGMDDRLSAIETAIAPWKR